MSKLAGEAFDLSDPDARYPDADEASEVLRRRGQNISSHRLKRFRTEGGGPPYVRNVARRVVYLHHVDQRKSPLIKWAATAMSAIATDTAGEAANIEAARAERQRRDRNH